jgi:AraC family transcriptional regulator, regulatory protein of adaptative response / methylated-DNA-[protein]-cysteine methyltransferase
MIEEIRFGITGCSLGYLLIARSSRGLCASLLGDDARSLRQDLERRFPKTTLLEVRVSDDPLMERAVALVGSDGSDAELPLDLQGTPFQLRVWQALREVGRGYTTTYAGIAAGIGSPRAIRAVAQACAANLVAVAIPCHRVICGNGDLSGYRWGVERKRALLAREVAA